MGMTLRQKIGVGIGVVLTLAALNGLSQDAQISRYKKYAVMKSTMSGGNMVSNYWGVDKDGDGEVDRIISESYGITRFGIGAMRGVYDCGDLRFEENQGYMLNAGRLGN